MKKILIPTDFSESANNALKYGIQMAKKLDYRITLLNIYSIPMYDPNMPAEMMNTAYQNVSQISKSALKKNYETITLEDPEGSKLIESCISKMGSITDEISLFASEGKFDIIIIGTTGASGVSEMLIGSNASTLISKTETPVIVVPTESKFKGMLKVVMPVELDGSEIKIITEARKILPEDCAIYPVHFKEENKTLSGDEQKAFANIQSALSENENAKIINSDDISTGLDEILKKYDCNLVLLSTIKRNIFEKLFHKSIAKKLVCHTTVPMLTLHKK
ncbi:universal stress protein [soil metagenome]